MDHVQLWQLSEPLFKLQEVDLRQGGVGSEELDQAVGNVHCNVLQPEVGGIQDPQCTVQLRSPQYLQE